MERIRLIIADDHPVVRTGLQGMLAGQPDFEVVGEATTGAEAVEMVAQLQPKVILMDLQMPEMDGVTATAEIKTQHPEIHVLILTTYDADADILRAVEAGATGYLLKDVPSEQLAEAVRAAARGEAFIHPSVTRKVVAEFTRLAEREHRRREQPLVEPLSVRELEVLLLLAEGLSNQEIADRLYIAPGTVKNHVSNILSKLGVRDRTQAVLRAQELGLL